MARALWVYILASAIAFVPDVATGQTAQRSEVLMLAQADTRLAIPMRDGVSSLNLATAVAAVLFSSRV